MDIRHYNIVYNLHLPYKNWTYALYRLVWHNKLYQGHYEILLKHFLENSFNVFFSFSSTPWLIEVEPVQFSTIYNTIFSQGQSSIILWVLFLFVLCFTLIFCCSDLQLVKLWPFSKENRCLTTWKHIKNLGNPWPSPNFFLPATGTRQPWTAF